MAFSTTNTVRVAIPEGCDVSATRLVFERFGEVDRVDRIAGEEPPRAEVVFFDVRAAMAAIEVLGTSYCEPAPQSGCRTAKLPGAGSFDPADLEAMSDAYPDSSEDGTFVLEFFDTRVAERYQSLAAKSMQGSGKRAAAPAKTTEAVAPPPGLPAPLGPETVLVRIAGVPNKLCSPAMVKTIVHQAALEEDITSVSAKTGKPSGEIIVGFACQVAAQACADHFEGCQWAQGKDGLTVQLVRIVVDEEDKASEAGSPEYISTSEVFISEETPMSEASTQDATPCASNGLSAAAAEWVPAAAKKLTKLTADAPAFIPAGAAAMAGLTAEAPVFVPGAMSVARFDEAAADVSPRKAKGGANVRTARRSQEDAGSETSTEIGETDEDDKISTKVAAVVPTARKHRSGGRARVVA